MEEFKMMTSQVFNPKEEEKRLINEERQRLVLNKREFVLQALESYRRMVNQGKSNAPIYEVKTRLQTLFEEIEPELMQDSTLLELKLMTENLESNNPALILDVWKFINQWLTKKALMKIFKPDPLL